MSVFPPTADGASARQYVLGQELQVTILTAAAETEGRHDVTDSVMPASARQHRSTCTRDTRNDCGWCPAR